MRRRQPSWRARRRRVAGLTPMRSQIAVTLRSRRSSYRRRMSAQSEADRAAGSVAVMAEMSREMGIGASGSSGRLSQLSRYTRNVSEQRDAVKRKYLDYGRKTMTRLRVYKK